jgi:hypothetical protein
MPSRRKKAKRQTVGKKMPVFKTAKELADYEARHHEGSKWILKRVHQIEATSLNDSHDLLRRRAMTCEYYNPALEQPVCHLCHNKWWIPGPNCPDPEGCKSYKRARTEAERTQKVAGADVSR